MKTRRPGSLLIVEDDRHVRTALTDCLQDRNYRVESAESCQDALERMNDYPFDVVLCDVHLPDLDGFHLLEWAADRRPDTAVVMLTGYGTIESAVEAIRIGACDYLTKPVRDDDLDRVIQRALGQRRCGQSRQPQQRPAGQRPQLARIVGRDRKMLEMFDLVRSVANTRTTVLILGESGTGKTLTARALHQLSDRRNAPFVEVACGALPENLLESELFGHVTGAFTGAVQTKPGKFLQADGGTVFLDEIDTASPALQVKLLRVLQDREFEAVGGTETHHVDVRLVLATNQDLDELVERGLFRQDLYYRINVITLTQPPLRERPGDIPLLAEHYLEIFNEQTGRQLAGIDDAALAALQLHPWPGNVRELVNVIERAVVLSKNDRISVDDLPETLRHRDSSSIDAGCSRGVSLKAALETPERRLILDALDTNGWNRQETANALGINRTTLYKKMKKFKIEAEPQLKQ